MAASQSSFGAQTYGHGEAPDRKNFWLSLIAVLGCFALFIAVVFVAYLPPNSEDSSGQTEVVQERLARLEEMRAKEATAADSYGWVNQPKGVVRIPVERAMTLFVARAAKGDFSVPATAAPAAAAEPAAAESASTETAATESAEQSAADSASAETPAASATDSKPAEQPADAQSAENEPSQAGEAASVPAATE